MNDPGIVSIVSGYPFADTLRRLVAAFESHGIKVFAVIDQQAEAGTVGLNMPPTTLILFGNPKSGTPLMLAQPSSGLDLPLKVLIAEAASGQVHVSFNAADYIVRRHSLPAALADNIAPAAALIENALKP